MIPIFDDDTTNDFFGDADYADLEVREPNSFKLPAGTHNVTISAAGKVTTKNGSAFRIEFTADGGKGFTQFFNPIEPGDETNVIGNTNMREIKRQERVDILGALGVPKDRIAKLNGEDLEGIEGTLRIYENKKGYMKFGSFQRTQGGRRGEPLRKAEPKPIDLHADVLKTAVNNDLAAFGF
jgi:hypothetical protein